MIVIRNVDETYSEKSHQEPEHRKQNLYNENTLALSGSTH